MARQRPGLTQAQKLASFDDVAQERDRMAALLNLMARAGDRGPDVTIEHVEPHPENRPAGDGDPGRDDYLCLTVKAWGIYHPHEGMALVVSRTENDRGGVSVDTVEATPVASMRMVAGDEGRIWPRALTHVGDTIRAKVRSSVVLDGERLGSVVDLRSQARS